MPSLVRPELPFVVDALESDVMRTGALSVLSHLAPAYPAAVSEVVPAVEPMIDQSETGWWALLVLESLARVDPSPVVPVMDAVTRAIEAVAGPESVSELACWGREGSMHGTSSAEFALRAAFSVCALVGKTRPDLVEHIEPHADRVAAGRYAGYRSALWLLAVLDYPSGDPDAGA